MDAVNNWPPEPDDQQPGDERAPVLSEVAVTYLAAVLLLLALLGAAYFLVWLVVPSWR